MKLSRRILALLIIVILVGGVSYADRVISGSKTFSITEKMATQQITPQSVMDSFVYIDSIIISPDTTVITWTSAPQTMILTPALMDGDTLTYICSLAYAANTVGFKYLQPDTATLPTLMGHITDSLNAVTGMVDSILAEDSTTYIKITSLFGTETFTARWSMILGDSLDTASHANLTTVQMIIDSMSNAIAESTFVDTMLWVSDIATYYIVTMRPDFAGDSLEIPTDTAQAVTQTQEPLYRRIEDTIKIANTIQDGQGIRGINATIILDSALYDYREFGELETAIVALRSTMLGREFTLDTLFSEAIPCTLITSVYNDTAFYQVLMLDVMIADTGTVVNDSTADYLLRWEIKAFDETVP